MHNPIFITSLVCGTDLSKPATMKAFFNSYKKGKVLVADIADTVDF